MISQPTIWEVFDGEYTRRHLRFKSPETAKNRRIYLGKLERMLQRRATLADLNDDNLSDLQAWLKSEGHAVGYRNSVYSGLCQFWRWCCKRGLVQQWPTVPREKQPDPDPVAWSQSQLQRLFSACRTCRQRKIDGVKSSLYWTGFHLVQWDTGERTGAMLEVEWEKLDLESGELFVPADVRKGKRKSRVYHLAEDTLVVLRLFPHPRHRRIFEFSKTTGAFYRRYKKLLESAGLPADRRSKPQRMRRSHASHLMAAGGNAQESLGHDSSATTAKFYIDRRIVKEDKPTDFLFRPDGGGQD